MAIKIIVDVYSSYRVSIIIRSLLIKQIIITKLFIIRLIILARTNLILIKNITLDRRISIKTSRLSKTSPIIITIRISRSKKPLLTLSIFILSTVIIIYSSRLKRNYISTYKITIRRSLS